MPETTLDELVAYFREHGERYAPEALRDHLVAQGYDSGLIDQALAAYRAQRAQPVGPEPGAEAPGGRWRGAASPYLIGLVVALGNFGLLALSFLWAASTISGQTGPGIGPTLALGLTLFAGEVLGGFLLLLAGWAEDPRAPGRNLGEGLLLGLVATGVLFLLAIGVCFVALG